VDVNRDRAVYTLRQTTQIVGIDTKTLKRWLVDLAIVPTSDPSDQRRRLLTEDHLQLLLAHARSRGATKRVLKANSPLGTYTHNVQQLTAQVQQLYSEVELLKSQRQAFPSSDAVIGWTTEQLTPARPSIETTHAIARLEGKLDAAVERFALVAAVLERMVARIALAPEGEPPVGEPPVGQAQGQELRHGAMSIRPEESKQARDTSHLRRGATTVQIGRSDRLSPWWASTRAGRVRVQRKSVRLGLTSRPVSRLRKRPLLGREDQDR